MASLRPALCPLIYADSESCADQRYFGRFLAPDSFAAFSIGRTKFALLNALEFSRGKKESAFDVILPLEDWLEKARQRHRNKTAGMAEVLATVAEVKHIRGFLVPSEFPVGLALRLRELGVAVEVADGPIFPQRVIKTEEEAAAIAEGNRISALGIAAGARLLREARVTGGKLRHRGRLVTSELLKEQIEIACLRAGGTSLNTIAAGGDQACDPHCRGTGPILPGQLVILDVFPRVNATGYYGDMTRTFLKGRASEAQRALVAAVAEGQKAALAKVRAGVSGRTVHAEVVAVFKRLGFETTRDERGPRGFFHGTGHGLGLAIHEAPRLNPSGPKLRAGMVVTVEPGLYYPGLGGARIEDVVLVTPDQPRFLSSAPYEWEIP